MQRASESKQSKMLWWLQDGREILYYIFKLYTGGGDAMKNHSGSFFRGECEMVEVLSTYVRIEEL